MVFRSWRANKWSRVRTFFLKCAVFCCASEKSTFKGRGGLHGEIWRLRGEGLGFDLGELWAKMGFLVWDTWVFGFFWADYEGYRGNKGRFG